MTDHDHEWVPLGNLQVCKVPGCNAHRAATQGAEDALRDLGDDKREPLDLPAESLTEEELEVVKTMLVPLIDAGGTPGGQMVVTAVKVEGVRGYVVGVESEGEQDTFVPLVLMLTEGIMDMIEQYPDEKIQETDG